MSTPATRFPDADILQFAIATSQRHGLAYWDAAIIEAARAAGCTEVYSEDLSPTQDYGGLCVVNPFS